jgi:hypothetical protein
VSKTVSFKITSAFGSIIIRFNESSCSMFPKIVMISDFVYIGRSSEISIDESAKTSNGKNARNIIKIMK